MFNKNSFAVQRAGSAYLNQSKVILPNFKKEGKVGVLISGIQYGIPFSDKIKYKLFSLSFIFGKMVELIFIKRIKKELLNSPLNGIVRF